MYGMFYDRLSLRKIDLSNFKTKNVNDMSNMFYGCSALIELNLSKFTQRKLKI